VRARPRQSLHCRTAAAVKGFSLEQHVPADHLLRSIERFVDLSGIREHRSLLSRDRACLDRPQTDGDAAPRLLRRNRDQFTMALGDLAHDRALTDAYATSRRERKNIQPALA